MVTDTKSPKRFQFSAKRFSIIARSSTKSVLNCSLDPPQDIPVDEGDVIGDDIGMV
jgi:hypothetical protein